MPCHVQPPFARCAPSPQNSRRPPGPDAKGPPRPPAPRRGAPRPRRCSDAVTHAAMRQHCSRLLPPGPLQSAPYRRRARPCPRALPQRSVAATRRVTAHPPPPRQRRFVHFRAPGAPRLCLRSPADRDQRVTWGGGRAAARQRAPPRGRARAPGYMLYTGRPRPRAWLRGAQGAPGIGAAAPRGGRPGAAEPRPAGAPRALPPPPQRQLPPPSAGLGSDVTWQSASAQTHHTWAEGNGG